jgi:hypothetical protein
MGVAYLQLHLQDVPTSAVASVEGSSRREQAQLGSYIEFPRRWVWDTSVYFVGRLPAQQMPSCTRLDTSVTWQAQGGLSFSLAEDNLLKDHHLEFKGSSQIVESSLVNVARA